MIWKWPPKRTGVPLQPREGVCKLSQQQTWMSALHNGALHYCAEHSRPWLFCTLFQVCIKACHLLFLGIATDLSVY